MSVVIAISALILTIPPAAAQPVDGESTTTSQPAAAEPPVDDPGIVDAAEPAPEATDDTGVEPGVEPGVEQPENEPEAEVAEDGTVRVMVSFDAPTGAARADSVEAAFPGEIEVIDEFESSDYVVAEVAADAVDDLAARPGINDVIVDQVATRALDDSVPLVNAPARWTEGFTGTGTTVAVIDDGVASGHPNLAGKVVAEACFTSPSGCGGNPSATGPGTAEPCLFCTHGTHVAGIAAGAGGGFDGVAPAASVFAIRVFGAAGASAFFSDVTLGLEHALDRADEFDIAAVNLSIQGGTKFTGACDTQNPPLTAAIGALTSRGIPVVAASGNGSFADGMSMPACITGVISVGSHSDALAVASSSNASALTSILAPGVDITSPLAPTGYSSVSGTSFAAPHVAGALAIWLDRFPGINDDEALFLSTAHDQTIFDDRNGLTYPRLFLDDPADVLVAGLFAQSDEAVGGTYQPLVGDFDGNGTDDIFWYAPGSSPDYVWSSTDRSRFSSRFEPVQGTYRMVVLDFDDDGRDDLFFHGPGTLTDHLWYGRSDGRFDKTTISLPGNQVPLVGDFDGDDAEDVFLYAAGPASDALVLGGDRSVSLTPLSIRGTYEPLVGDFDGDSADDIFWYAAGSSSDYLWYGGGGPNGFTSVQRNVNGTYDPFVGDFGGDGASDIYWYRAGSAPDYVWRGDGRGPFDSTYTPVTGSYVPSVVEADGIGGDEILWYSVSNGADYFWTFEGTSRSSVEVGGGDGGQVLTGTFDASGGADLFFYRPGPAAEAVWYSIGAPVA
ncbi:MAG TPA: S8 family serine peptidase [Acidimicrobiales bacterium]|nr:S8 family serine peptidase [Acidimicrobiales bacterium]